MQIALSSCVFLSLFFSAHTEVVKEFQDVPECMEYFYKGKVPEWGASTPGVVRICQRYENRYHFATLYDTFHRIAVYSAYQFQRSDEGGRETRWFVEPQLVNRDWPAEMMRSNVLDDKYSGVYQGEKQALDEDYIGSSYDRGHLNPNGHHDDTESRKATFTLTNVVPQNHKLNQRSWKEYESRLTNLFMVCSKAYVLVGAIPSEKNWITKNKVNRVNIPDYLWNAYCCVDENDEPILSGAARAKNTEENKVEEMSLGKVRKFLWDVSKQPVGELFHNNCEWIIKRLEYEVVIRRYTPVECGIRSDHCSTTHTHACSAICKLAYATWKTIGKNNPLTDRLSVCP